MEKNILNINLRLLLIFWGVFGCISTAISQDDVATVSSKVVDEQQMPLEGVSVYVQDDQSVITNSEGVFELRLSEGESVTFEKNGYETLKLSALNIEDEIKMRKLESFRLSDDEVNLGFYRKNKRNIAGAVASIKPEYFSDFDNTQWVRSAIEGRLVGVKGSSNIRGLGDAMVVIDGIPGRSMNFLNMDEVEEITVLKDANALALYGSQARNGVIVVTTKTGGLNSKKAEFSINYSLKDPIAYPEYLGSTEYMELYNIARANDGRDPFYPISEIEGWNTETNPYKYPDVDLYSSEYLKSSTFSTDVIAQFSGGTEKLLYYVNMGWNHDGSLEKLNPDANKGSNRFNIRGNLDFEVNDFIRSSIGILSVINVNQQARQSVLSVGTSFKPNAYAPLIPVSKIDTENNPELEGVLEAAKIYDGNILGTSLDDRDNAPIANIIAGGDRTYINQTTQFNNSINFDLNRITEGLSARTYLSFDFYDASTKARSNDYKVYYPETWQDNSIISLVDYGNDTKDLEDNMSTRDFISRYGFYLQLNYNKDLGINHHLDASAIGYYNSTSIENNIQNPKNAHVGMHLGYKYKGKLLVDFNSNYSNSIKFKEGNRGAFSPTLGLAYILSEETFLKDDAIINYLKIRGSAGLLHSDVGINDYFLYKSIYRNQGTGNFGWNDGGQNNRLTKVDQIGNPDIGYEKRQDVNLGLEALLLNSLWIDFNAFNSEILDQVTILSNRYPSFYNTFRPSSNYNEDRYRGIEVGVNYSKSVGDFTANIGGNLMYTESEKTKRDEVYDHEYERAQGTSVEAIWGLKADGFYGVDDFDENGELTEGLPESSFTKVQPGDIKYEDKNVDGTIDNLDQQAIGRWTNPLSYSINLRLKYRGFSLFVIGTGQAGGESNMNNDYYRVDGNDKYSAIVRGHWTPETAKTATYPRLSSENDSHNYRNSSFWLYNDSYFKINRTQLSYEFNDYVCKKLNLKKLIISVSGTNLVHFAANKDIRELNIGSSPQFRYYTVGLRTSF